MRLRPIIPLVASAGLLAAACSSSEPGTPDASEQMALQAGPPALVPCDVSGGSVEVDGVTIQYVVSAPPGFAAGDEAPLLLAFPLVARISISHGRSSRAPTHPKHKGSAGWS